MLKTEGPNLILMSICEGWTFCVDITDTILTQDFDGEYSDYSLEKFGVHISTPMVSHSLEKIELKASQLKNHIKSEKVTSVTDTKSPTFTDGDVRYTNRSQFLW